MTPIAGWLERGSPPLPWVYGAAGRLAGETRTAMLTDAGALTRSLSTAADLFDLPAVSTSFDPTLTAEAAGCAVELGDGDPRVVDGCIASVDDAFDVDLAAVAERGRVPAVLDATERLVATLDGTSVLGGITGPRTLADALLGEDGADDEVRDEATLTAGDVAIELANAYLDRDADGLALLEPGGLRDADRYRDAMTPLVNVVDHFGAACVVVQRTVDADDVALAGDLGVDAVTGRVEEPGAVLAAAEGTGTAIGVGVPGVAFLGGPDTVDAFVEAQPAGTALSSEWEVPRDAPPEALHRLMGSG